jgi:hypothetical protein
LSSRAIAAPAEARRRLACAGAETPTRSRLACATCAPARVRGRRSAPAASSRRTPTCRRCRDRTCGPRAQCGCERPARFWAGQTATSAAHRRSSTMMCGRAAGMRSGGCASTQSPRDRRSGRWARTPGARRLRTRAGRSQQSSRAGLCAARRRGSERLSAERCTADRSRSQLSDQRLRAWGVAAPARARRRFSRDGIFTQVGNPLSRTPNIGPNRQAAKPALLAQPKKLRTFQNKKKSPETSCISSASSHRQPHDF